MPETLFNLTGSPISAHRSKFYSPGKLSLEMHRPTTNQQNTRINRERDVRAFSRLVILLCCGLLLAVGFVFAARQHFAAVRLGYESESLRSERQQLLAEHQRLLLEKEQATAPARLEAAARELGLKPLKAGQVGSHKTNEPKRLPLATALINPSASLNR
jgi:cell division protein FtsL